MRNLILAGSSLALLLASNIASAQPPGITMEMINTTLPLEGAPLAEPGPYTVLSEGAFNSPGHRVYRPVEMAAFPTPILVWGNGGCAIDDPRYAGFLTTIASHGFLVLTTAAVEGEPRRQGTAADMLAAIAWAEAENERDGSPLKNLVDTSKIAVMGTSCSGFLSIGLGADPRVDTIGVFNSGVVPPNPEAPAGPFPTTAALADIHGPVMFINGHEVDFMMDESLANYELVSHVPAFYGARHNAGHIGTAFHPGGGEFANVISHWLLYQLKGDAEAGKMFVGADCELCTNPNWDTDSKGME